MMNVSKNIALIVAGGKGRRMNSTTKKQYLELAGKPVLSRTLSTFCRSTMIDEIILVIPEEDIAFCTENIVASFMETKHVHICAGGDSRQESVFKGLTTIKTVLEPSNDCTVLVHDGVRPFIDEQLIETCIEITRKTGSCIPCVQLVDTIKRIDRDGCIKDTVDRTCLYAAQTPQTFRFDTLYHAYQKALKTGFTGTDDASIVENIGIRPAIAQGSLWNIKITTPRDLQIAQSIHSIVSNRK